MQMTPAGKPLAASLDCGTSDKHEHVGSDFVDAAPVPRFTVPRQRVPDLRCSRSGAASEPCRRIGHLAMSTQRDVVAWQSLLVRVRRVFRVCSASTRRVVA
jgi:hypothetical protein